MVAITVFPLYLSEKVAITVMQRGYTRPVHFSWGSRSMFARRAAQTIGIGILVFAGVAKGGEPEQPARKLVLQSPATTSVCSVAVSPDGQLVAAATGAGGIRIHDANSGALVRVIDDVGDRSVVFSPDGRRIAAAGFQMDKVV